MTDIFLTLLNRSISAGWLVLAVLLLRQLLRKGPKWIRPVLWALVGLRLVWPFSIESVLSLIPSAETVRPDILYASVPEVSSGIPAVNNAVNPVLQETFAPQPEESVNPLQVCLFVAALIWGIGCAVIVFYTLYRYLRLKNQLKMAVRMSENIYQAENIPTPFVLGILQPRIYLPYHMAVQNMEYVIAHEQAHIKRFDHCTKPIGFLLLALYWFHPLMWIAYILFCRDIELACDEQVIQNMGARQRADYSQALLSCSMTQRMISACPLAFGEVGVKVRVKQVLGYQKPAFWLTVVAVVVCVVVGVCFLTNPEESQQISKGPDAGKAGSENSDVLQGHLEPLIEDELLDPPKGWQTLSKGDSQKQTAPEDPSEGEGSAAAGKEENTAVKSTMKVQVDIGPMVLAEPQANLSDTQKKLLEQLPVEELPKEAVALYPFLEETIWKDTLIPLAYDSKADVTLYGVWSDMRDETEDVNPIRSPANADGIVLRQGARSAYYPLCWEANAWCGSNPWMAVDDFNGDGRQEAAICLYSGHGTGFGVENLYLFDLETLTYSFPDSSTLEIAVSYEADTRMATLSGGRQKLEIEVPDYLGDFEEVYCGNIVSYEYKDGQLFCLAKLDFSGVTTGYLAQAQIPIVWQDGQYRFGPVSALTKEEYF